MREERRVVTVLSADLVGSTALGEQLDPEEARLVVGEAVSRMVAAVEDMDGTVKDLAGDGVLALFGAPVAHENDPERAVRAGLRIVEQIESYGAEVERGWGIAGFSVRVGLCSGPVVLGPVGSGRRIEYGATGDAVNTAARLQAAAPPGGVLVGESTYRLTRPLFDWGERQALSLKGKAEPVVAYRALSPAKGPAADRPGARALTDSPLVGRERELAVASEAVRSVLAGAGGIVFVTGEAGIGKSRLLAELRRELEGASSEGGRPLWLDGRCTSYDQTLPFGPFRDLLRAWLRLAPDAPELRVQVALRRAVEELRGEQAADAYPFLAAILGLPVEALRPDALTAEAHRTRTFDAVEALLAQLSGRGPLVVALDDFHWADPTSIDLANRLLALPDRVPLLLVVAQRVERDHGSWRLRERAFREVPHRTADVALEPLSEAADAELLAALAGSDTVPVEVESRLLAAAGGNPFFLEELVRSLQDAGTLVQAEGGWQWRFEHEGTAPIPETVEKAILARLDRLSPSCQATLTAASVLGRRFGLALLESVADDDVPEALRELQRLDLVREARRWPDPEYQFKHLLTQETAYRTLVGSRRSDLHRRAARALERLFSDRLDEHLGILAHHHLQAGDPERACEYRRRAGDAAARAYATEEALEEYSKALEIAAELGSKPARVGKLHLERGRVSYRAGRYPEARSDYETALVAAREEGDRRLELRALESLGSLLVTWGARMRDAIPHLEDALEIAEELADGPARVSILNRLSIVSSNRLRFDQARRYSDRALALAAELDDERVLATAMDGAKMVAAHLGDFPALRATLPGLASILRRHDELWYLQWTVFESSFPLMAEGRWADAESVVEEALALNRRIGDRANEPQFLAALGWLHRARGDYGRALAAGQEASKLAVALEHPWWTGWSEAMLGWTLLELNAVDDAIAHLHRGLRAASGTGASFYALCCAGHLAWGQWLAGDRAAALSTAERTERLLADVSTPPGTAFVHGAPPTLAVAAVRAEEGDFDRAERLVSPLVAASEQSGWRETIAAGSGLLGRWRLQRGDLAEAERHLRRALEVASASGLPGEEWKAHAALAEAVRLRGRPAEAVTHVGHARLVVDRLAETLEEGRLRRGYLAGAQAALAQPRPAVVRS